MIKSGIYKITCTVNGRFYIGKTRNYHQRIFGYISKLKNNICGNYLMQKYYNEFGSDSITYELIEECPVSALNLRERYYIINLKPHMNTYNYSGNGKNKQPGIRRKSLATPIV